MKMISSRLGIYILAIFVAGCATRGDICTRYGTRYIPERKFMSGYEIVFQRRVNYCEEWASAGGNDDTDA